ncbi:MAG: polysaccharide deacetylase [Conexivisphaerales archaeon]
MPKQAEVIKVAITVDVDAIAGWLGSYGGENSPSDLSRGEFAGKIGTLRLLDLFERQKIKTTWFVPGHSAETFKVNLRKVADLGHEIEPHGYSHENPTRLNREQEEKILIKTSKLCEELSGNKPVGYRAPWWEFSENTVDLLLKHNFMYDSSMMADEFHPYRLRSGDRWYKIDYTKDPETWMKPFEFGKEVNLVEIPVSWYLDDLPPMMFIKHPSYNYGYTSPEVMYGIYKAHFDYLFKVERYGCLCLTIHPDVSARPHVLPLLERLINYIKRHERVRFSTLSQIASEFIEGKRI